MSCLLKVLAALGIFLIAAVASSLESRVEAVDPCVGLPNSGLLAKDTVIQSGASPYLGVWWGRWSPTSGGSEPSNAAPSFFIVRAVSGDDVDVTNIPFGVVELGQEYWRMESDGHIGANFPADSASYIYNYNRAGDLLLGTLYKGDQAVARTTMSRCTPPVV
jgi:hypothetical protein